MKILVLFLWPTLFFSCSGLAERNIEPSVNGTPLAAKILAVRENKKHKLKCTFYGTELDLPEKEKATAIEYVILQDEVSGREMRYAPTDETSVVSSLGYFTDVWSTDEEYLVLPSGRFEGFCIIRSENAFATLSHKKCTDRIRIQAKDGPQLWHDFNKWIGKSSFEFEAGLSGSNYRFRYDIETQAIYPTERGKFQGENNRGMFEINN